MNRKHNQTLEAIFSEPIRSNLPWMEVETLFSASARKYRREMDQG